MKPRYKQGSADEEAVVRMFCAYCRRTLANARTDYLRERSRNAGRERLFSDMREAELNRLVAPEAEPRPVAVFEVGGAQVGVADPEISSAIRRLCATDQSIVLMRYFAEWSDGRIGVELGLPRSTVQWRRANALDTLRVLLGDRGARA